MYTDATQMTDTSGDITQKRISQVALEKIPTAYFSIAMSNRFIKSATVNNDK
jgi:hypothetical protein